MLKRDKMREMRGRRDLELNQAGVPLPWRKRPSKGENDVFWGGREGNLGNFPAVGQNEIIVEMGESSAIHKNRAGDNFTSRYQMEYRERLSAKFERNL